MALLYRLIDIIFSLFEAALIIYVILSWIRPSANRWTELLRRVVEPVLSPVRRFLVAKMPRYLLFLDWSPVAVLLAMRIIRRLLVNLLW